MWRILGKLSFFVLLSSMMQSCLTTGRDFPSRLEWIQKERTKRDDVALVLGQPYAVGNSDGTPTWTYAYYKYSLFDRTYYKELRFYWTPSNEVKSFTFNSSFPDDTKTTK